MVHIIYHSVDPPFYFSRKEVYSIIMETDSIETSSYTEYTGIGFMAMYDEFVTQDGILSISIKMI